MTPSPQTPLPVGAMTALACAMLLASVGISIVTIALPSLAEAFETTVDRVQWLVIAYLLAVITTIVPVGRLGDMYGRRRVLRGGILVFTCASFLCVLAPTLNFLIAARGLQGLGGAAVMALTMSAVRDSVPTEKTGSAMGLLGTMSAVGTALGPSLGGVLIATMGWRAVFVFLTLLGLMTLGLTHRFLGHDTVKPTSSGRSLDPLGILLLACSLAAYAMALTARDGSFTIYNGVMLCIAILGLGIFAKVETRVSQPLIDISTFRDMSFSAALVMNALVSIVMMTMLVVGPFFLKFGLGLDDIIVGLVMTIGPALSALSGVPAGRITDHFGAKKVVLFGLVQLMMGAFLLSLLSWFMGLPGFIAGFVVLTPGYQLFLAGLNTDVMQSATADRRGVVSGILNLSRNLGFLTGASMMSAIFAVTIGRGDIINAPPQMVITGFSITLLVGAALVMGALAVAVRNRNIGQTQNR